MSSTSWNDTSIMEQASAMSCKVQLELAKAEYDKNASRISYQIINPNCDKFAKLADRTDEYKLLLNGGLTKNQCFTHDPALKTGDYFLQIENMRTESFDKWTRIKTIRKPKNPNVIEPIYNLDQSYYDCYHAIPEGFCALNNDTAFTIIPCPKKCGIHPHPCPNPIR